MKAFPLLVLLATQSSSFTEQPAVRTSIVVSSSVIATFFDTRQADGSYTLDLLILWRGTPGWLLTPEGHGVSSGGSGHFCGPPPDCFVPGAGEEHVYAGGRDLVVRLHPYAGTVDAEVLGQTFTFGGNANVVLVDNADQDDPTITQTLHVDPPMPEGHQIWVVIKRSPILQAFLQCDVRLPDANAQFIMDIICAPMLSR